MAKKPDGKNTAKDAGLGLKEPPRRKMPPEREAVTHKFKILPSNEPGEIRGYLTVGFYDDGSVGEIFCKLDKQGGTVSGFMDQWAIAVSMLLQVGVPLKTICDKYRNCRFEPSGRTDTPGIRYAYSAVDYVARYLDRRYVQGKELVDD
jgi:ribonucleoside-diphosphate reductase alpha chain